MRGHAGLNLPPLFLALQASGFRFGVGLGARARGTSSPLLCVRSAGTGLDRAPGHAGLRVPSCAFVRLLRFGVGSERTGSGMNFPP